MFHPMLLFLIDVCPTSIPFLLRKTHGSKKDKFPCSLFDFLNLKPRGIPLTMVFRTVYIISFDFCHPSSKLLEGNVSTRACLFSGRERDAITHDALDLTVQGLPVLVPASGGIWWSQLGTCLNLLTLGPYGTDIW